ncbi:hypothetical protein [Cupriavidus sp. BIS7]|uniref:hypothetical protein n=1 Tax=Cupriavidus sp. BIS7 TaxID=1217718 RepID=UPI001ED94015|nr:hypothetical protein [Cupriavidus sp. BIS7]
MAVPTGNGTSDKFRDNQGDAMFRKTMQLACASVLLGLSVAAAAHGGGGGGGMGAPSGHGGHEAAMNSNGAFSSDRDKGQQRASDRRSVAGTSHEKAQDNRMHNNGNHSQKH